MSGVTNRQTGEAAQAVAPRPFKAQLEPRLRRLVEDGSLPRGSVWGIRVIEAGESINGITYTEEAVKNAAPIFEGCPVRIYSWGEQPDAADAGHVPEIVQEVAGGFLVGNDVGSLEGCHFNEEAKALDAYFKVYDEKVRGRMLEAFDLGDIGEGATRDAFGFSIDARGDTSPESDTTVIAFTEAKELTMVRDPAAGGRVRRLVASAKRSSNVVTKTKNLRLVESAKRLTEAVNELEAAAKLRMVFEEASDQIRSTLWNDDLTVAEKATKLAAVAGQLVEATQGEAPAETMTEAVMFREAAATFAGKLKLMADALSAAPDDQALDVLKGIQAAVADAVKTESGEAVAEPDGTTTPDAQEGDDMAKNNAAAKAQQDEFARMSAGVTEALKSESLDPKVRKALIEALGHEPDETQEQGEIRALRKRLQEQAIRFEFNRLTEGVDGTKVHDADLVFGLLDRGAIKVAEDSSVTGVREAFDALLAAKPFLKVAEAAAPDGDGAGAAGEGEGEGDGANTGAAGDGATAAAAATAAAGTTVQEGQGAGGAAPAKPATTALATGVSLRESMKPATRPPLSDAKRARLQKRLAGGDVSAMTELRLARGHRW